LGELLGAVINETVTNGAVSSGNDMSVDNLSNGGEECLQGVVSGGKGEVTSKDFEGGRGSGGFGGSWLIRHFGKMLL